MQARLIVKNFGPIDEVDLDLRNVNVFIGPQASGKSALAKVYTICKSPLNFYDDGTNKNLNGFGAKLSNADRFKKILDDYNVGSFLNDDTYISFSSELHDFEYSKDGIKYDRKIFKKIEELEKLGEDLEGNRERINEILIELNEKLIFLKFSIKRIFKSKVIFNRDGFLSYLVDNLLTSHQFEEIVDVIKYVEDDLSSSLALYIPSERNFVVMLKDAALNLLNNDVPIPKNILSFGAQFEKSSHEKKELDLGFLKPGLLYKNEAGLDKIYFSETQSIKLSEAASGLQSIVPLLLPILSIRDNIKGGHYSFVIEEPELNLFPKAQYELIKLLEKDRIEPVLLYQDMGTIHTYTTHSPYILSAFNNLLYSSKTLKQLTNKEANKKDLNNAFISAIHKVENILPTQIEAPNFSAYQICDGKAQSIFNREKGLIEDNYIDEVTDKMGDDFDALMELMEEA